VSAGTAPLGAQRQRAADGTLRGVERSGQSKPAFGLARMARLTDCPFGGGKPAIAGKTLLRKQTAGTDAVTLRGDRVGVEGTEPLGEPDRRRPEAAHPSGCRADGTGCLPTDPRPSGRGKDGEARRRSTLRGASGPSRQRQSLGTTRAAAMVRKPATFGWRVEESRIWRGASFGRRQTDAPDQTDPTACTRPLRRWWARGRTPCVRLRRPALRDRAPTAPPQALGLGTDTGGIPDS
jgi:hypothetical protein